MRGQYWNLPGIPSDLVQEYKTATNARLLTEPFTSGEVASSEGYFFRTFQYVVVPASSSKFIKFTGPTAGVRFALRGRSIAPNLAGLKYNIYNGAADIVTTGAAWTIFNENSNSANVSGSEFLNVATIGALGMWSDTAFVPQGGTGQKTQGSITGDSGFKILEPDTTLILELENLSNAANEVLVYLQWTEIPT